jgi:flagellar biosynthesis component FlhA
MGALVKILIGYFTGLSSTTVMILGICAAVTAWTLWFHHATVKTEDNRIQIVTDRNVFKVQEANREIRNRSYSSGVLLNRLQRHSW